MSRRWLGLAFLLLAVLAAPGLSRLSVDNSPEAFFLRDAAALERYEELLRAFGRDRSLRLVLEGPGLWSREGLAWIGEVERRARALNGVLGAAGLWGHHAPHLGEWPPPDPAGFRAAVLTDRFDRDAGWVSPDGGAITVWVVLYHLPPSRQRQTLAQLEELLAEAPPGVEAVLAGLPVFQRALDHEVVGWAARFFPLLVLLAAVLLALAFGGPRGAAPPLVFVAVCQTLVFGGLGWLAVDLDMVTMVLVPLMLVIPLATAVHLSVRFRQLAGQAAEGREGRRAAVAETWREKRWPVLWAGVTTAAGFASLATSPAPPVRTLGLAAAAGVAAMTLAAFTFYPALLGLLPAAGARPSAPGAGSSPGGGAAAGFEVWGRHRGRQWAAWAVARRRQVATVFALAAAVALTGLVFLQRESEVLAYLGHGNPVRQRIEALERRGVGIVAADLMVSAAEGETPFTGAAGLERLARLAGELRSEPRLLGVVSAGDLLASEVRWTRSEAAREEGASGAVAGPRAEETAEEVLERLRDDPDKGPLFNALVTREGDRARLSLLLPMQGFDELEPLLARAEQAARGSFPAAEVGVTGQYPLVLAVQRSLLRTTIVSLTLTFVVVALVFLALLRRPRLALAALAANLFPVAGVLGAMGWLGVPLDSSTVMIAAVVLGLAVDDTLHTLGRYRREVKRLEPAAAAVATLERTAPAHLLTSAVLALGFAVCGLSSFVPVARFGGLMALAVTLALAADLLLMPALLAGTRPRDAAARSSPPPAGRSAPPPRPR